MVPFIFEDQNKENTDFLTWAFCLQAAVHLEDPKADDDKVMSTMLTMVHSLISSAEMFLKHGSISTKGGFAVSINGIKIFKVSPYNVKTT